MFYWAITWKKYGQEDLYVTDKQKEYIEDEWVKEPDQRKSQTFKLNGETYSYNSIDSITRSNKRIEAPTTKLLYAAEATMNDRSPVLDDDGDVVSNFYKKLVTVREYDNYYGKHPSYITLDKEDGGVWVAMRLPEHKNTSQSDNVELCDEKETERLWNIITKS